jgi:Ca2+-transporting ATPase
MRTIRPRAAVPAVRPEGAALGWHTLSPAEATAALGVDPLRGLDGDEAGRRLAQNGPNALERAPRTPVWRRIRGLVVEPMAVTLMAAAALSAVVSRELRTPVVILAVVAFNAVVNLVQERRAQDSLEALRDMTVTRANVRRDARVLRVDAEDLVVGDVVLLEAGDVVPADGRLLEVVGLEVQEAALTGESGPSPKTVRTVSDVTAAVVDRSDVVFMSTEVTRGRGVVLVTGTGMGTEIGRLAGLLDTTRRGTTPLQRQMARLAATLSVVAVVVVVIVVLLGLLRGAAPANLFLTAVALAVATIPEGLPAVVAFTLAMGAGRLAARGAIIKSLSSVETLGSTAHIAADKTGTLTLNEMTACELFAQQRAFRVSGEGYGARGEICATGEAEAPDIRPALLAMALASEAVVSEGVLAGDPTEGALVVLAAKGGVDATTVRRDWPRVCEIPFDSDRRYMATFHRWATGSGGELAGIRVFVKGGPDVVVGRSVLVDTPRGPVTMDDAQRTALEALNADLGSRGLRVMAVAQRDLEPDEIDACTSPDGDPEALDPYVRGLTLLALVAIVDPPRPEAREAVRRAHEAGIAVHMITGDHVGTASAIAKDLGIRGEAVSGAQLDAMGDDELARRAAEFGVLARVGPEHKLRVVDALRSSGSVVAMTGDGVNDAPALKRADVGIAMGVTGTEVAKGAASMILTDDNFATIVWAVREGRGIYDNVAKFVRFQVATSWGFVLAFLVAGVVGLAGGAAFTALQVLWVNIIMDGPPAMALGLDPPDEDVMQRPPRPVGEQILTRARIGRIALAAGVMAAGTLGVLTWTPGPAPAAGAASDAGSLAFTTFVFFQAFNLLNVRSRDASVFSRHTLTNGALWVALATIVVLQVVVVTVPALQGLFSTTTLSGAHWVISVVVASSVLWVEEVRKAVSRARRRL